MLSMGSLSGITLTLLTHFMSEFNPMRRKIFPIFFFFNPKRDTQHYLDSRNDYGIAIMNSLLYSMTSLVRSLLIAISIPN